MLLMGYEVSLIEISIYENENYFIVHTVFLVRFDTVSFDGDTIETSQLHPSYCRLFSSIPLPSVCHNEQYFLNIMVSRIRSGSLITA